MNEEKDHFDVSSGFFPADSIERYLPEKMIHNRKKILQLENLISDLSSALIDAYEENLENELNYWLIKFVEFLEVDRGVINKYLDNKTVQVLTTYTVPGVDAAPLENTYRTPEGEIEEFQKGITISAEKIPEDLPQMLRGGLIERENTKSLVIVPLSISGRVIGSLSFISFRKKRKWPEDLIRRIKLIGEIIANTVQRINVQQALSEEVNRRQVLEEKYSSIIKNANVGFWITDRDRNILEVNDEYCRMSGYSRTELLSMNISDVDISLNPERKAELYDIIKHTGAIHLETTHIKKDGSFLDLDVSSTREKTGKLLYCFMRDITELNQWKKAQAERLGFEELVSDFSAALININLDDLFEELKKWVIKFVDFLEIGRGVINEYEYDKNTIKVLVSYTDPGEEPHTSPHDSDLQAPDGVLNAFRNGKIIRAEKIPEDLQEPFRGWIIEKHNTKSLVVVPLVSGYQVIGNLTFASYRKERKWSDDIFGRIKLIGEIIANAILRKRASDALLEEIEHRQIAEERYSQIIKNTNVGFWISAMDGSILEVNDAYCKMSGYSREELLGKTIEHIDISLDKEKTDKERNAVIEEGALHHETSHIRKDGTIIDVAVNSNLIKEEGVIFSFTRDITELNQARKEVEERLIFETLIAEFSAALINASLNDIKNDINQWLERFAKLLNVDRLIINEYKNDYTLVNLLFSYTNPDIETEAMPIGSEPIKTYGFHKYLKRGEYIIIGSSTETFPEDIENGINEILKSGEKSFLLIPVSVGDNLLGAMSISTILQKKIWTKDLIIMLGLVAEIFANALMRDKTNSELDNYRRRLEEMVEERTVKLEKAQKELVVSEKMATLGRLTATVSHELRNPLGTIRTSIYSLQKRLQDQNEKVLNTLNRAERNIIRCDLIIEDLLDYSRTQWLNLKPTVLDEWMGEIIGEIGPPYGIIVEQKLNSGATINMDRERFRRCIVNIMTNAYQAIQEKDSSGNGCVSVRTYQDNNLITIDISDDGVGFDIETVEKIYEPLYSTKSFGIGLGIPITKQIIKQHGWHMEITGAPREGASVKIIMPAIVK